ncbi:MAG: hypothetical protein EXR76_19255 [Myxococcales bacterium]|nr:hypothetical protein [Myxococcales bacterium]
MSDRALKLTFVVAAAMAFSACQKDEPNGESQEPGADMANVSNDIGVGGAGGGGEGGAVAVLDMGATPEPGMGEEPPEAECGPDVTVLDLNAEGTADGTAFNLTGSTGADDYFTGGCTSEGSIGSDAVVRFTAPTAGFWMFSTVGSAIEDTVLYALEDCNDGFSEKACSDDIGEGNTQSQLLVELAADETVYLIIDQFDGVDPAEFQLRAEPSTATAPVITELLGLVNPEVSGVGFRLTGTDADSDVSSFRWGMADDQGNELMLTQTGPIELDFASPDIAGLISLISNPDGTFTAEGAINLQDAPPIGSIYFEVGDALGLWSERADADTMVSDVVRMNGEVCDPARTLDACPETDACIDPDMMMAFTCRVATTPVLVTSAAGKNADGKGFGIRLQGTDPENDVAFVRMTARDIDGEELFFGDEPGTIDIGFFRLQQADGSFDGIVSFTGFFQGLCFPAAQAHFEECTGAGGNEGTCVDEANVILAMCNTETAARIATFQVSVVDQALKATALTDVAVGQPAEGMEGAVCDTFEALAACVVETACVPNDGALDSCQAVAAICPEDFGVVSLNENEVGMGSWRMQGDTSEAINVVGSGSCGGGGPQAIFGFTAPAAGTYHAQISGIGGMDDTLLFARTHCTAITGRFELACNDDVARGNLASAVDVDLTEGQLVYFVVDGYDGSFAGTFTLQVDQN